MQQSCNIWAHAQFCAAPFPARRRWGGRLTAQQLIEVDNLRRIKTKHVNKQVKVHMHAPKQAVFDKTR